MIGFLVPLAARLGVPEPLRRLVAIAAIALSTLALLGVVKCSYDRSVVAAHEARADAATAKADRRADTKAAETRRVDDARLTAERTELERIAPDATSPVPARAARLRCIRLQQDARAAGREPPACSGPQLPGRTARP